MASIQVTAARVITADGHTVATIDRIDVGGGTQVVTVDGTAETRVHAESVTWHVRLLSPDRMIPDSLREVGNYDEAVHLGLLYAEKVDANAEKLAAIAHDLKV